MIESPSLAQVELRDRSGDPSCEQANELFCLGWAVDNFDRYVDPTLEHLVLVGASVVAGFAIAFGLALLAHRIRWLSAPLLAGDRRPLHGPEHRLLLPAVADHRARPHDTRSSP